jgi:choline dehydrogenase-like flavoprotein
MPVAPAHTSPLAKDYLAMAESLHLTTSAPLSAPSQPAFQVDYSCTKCTIMHQVPLVHQRHGQRADTYRTYLANATGRPNLRVVKHARVTKVLVDEAGRAVGVRYTRYGSSVEVLAGREVVLAAGTVGSARLLLLAGIGPAGQLAGLGIPLVGMRGGQIVFVRFGNSICKVRDLPVGRNLQDHLTTSLGPFLLNSPVAFDPASMLRHQSSPTFTNTISKTN